LKARVEALGRRYEYLPPYSPDFNPIEEAFKDLKAWIRRHYELRKPKSAEFDRFLAEGLRETGKTAPGHFHHCEMVVPGYSEHHRRGRTKKQRA